MTKQELATSVLTKIRKIYADLGAEKLIYVGVAALFAAAAVLIWLPIGGAASDVPAARSEAGPAETSGDSVDTETFSTTIAARPLFHITRRPPKAEVAPAPAAVTISLAGIVEDGDRTFALIRLSSAPGIHRRAVGESIGKWTIRAILPNAVEVVSTDGDRRELVIGSDN